ncbi:MAG: hypothetical protein GKR88_01475 [Flavobacteriaceae bacterium]|nr:MAG: hypothetical protein GKR88_01475 [Flavobacteriaceae bacterium]
MKNYYHPLNTNDSSRQPVIIWNSKKLPVPINLFDTADSVNKKKPIKKVDFWITINPSISNKTIERILKNNLVKVIRISSSKYKSDLAIVDEIKRIRKIIGIKKIEIALDLSGPKVRISAINKLSQENKLNIYNGDKVVFVPENNLNEDFLKRHQNYKVVPYKGEIYKSVKSDFLLVSDGWNQFKIIKELDSIYYCEALHEFILYNQRGIDIVGMYDRELPMQIISQDTLSTLLLANVLNYLDWICISFANSSKIINEVKNYIKTLGNFDIKLMAKIETKTSLENINQICDVSDGIMIARGDLAVQLAVYGIDMIKAEDIVRKVCSTKDTDCVIATRVADSLDGTQKKLSENELYLLKHEIFSNHPLTLMLANETSEDESAEANFKIVVQVINGILVKK